MNPCRPNRSSPNVSRETFIESILLYHPVRIHRDYERLRIGSNFSRQSFGVSLSCRQEIARTIPFLCGTSLLSNRSSVPAVGSGSVCSLDSPLPVRHTASLKESVRIKAGVISLGDSGELFRNVGDGARFVPVVQCVCLPNHVGYLLVVLACHRGYPFLVCHRQGRETVPARPLAGFRLLVALYKFCKTDCYCRHVELRPEPFRNLQHLLCQPIITTGDKFIG